MKEVNKNHKLVLEPSYPTSATTNSTTTNSKDNDQPENQRPPCELPEEAKRNASIDQSEHELPGSAKVAVKTKDRPACGKEDGGRKFGGKEGIDSKRTDEEQRRVNEQLRDAMDGNVGS